MDDAGGANDDLRAMVPRGQADALGMPTHLLGSAMGKAKLRPKA